jgi:hypothetical protein
VRKRVLALAVSLLAPSAFATPAGPEPALTAGASSFELFGTRFCLGAARGCDVTFEREPAPAALPAAAGPTAVRGQGRAVSLFGLKLCSAPRDGVCHVIWSPPPPAAGWRDFPELRVASR